MHKEKPAIYYEGRRSKGKLRALTDADPFAPNRPFTTWAAIAYLARFIVSTGSRSWKLAASHLSDGGLGEWERSSGRTTPNPQREPRDPLDPSRVSFLFIDNGSPGYLGASGTLPEPEASGLRGWGWKVKKSAAKVGGQSRRVVVAPGRVVASVNGLHRLLEVFAPDHQSV